MVHSWTINPLSVHSDIGQTLAYFNGLLWQWIMFYAYFLPCGCKRNKRYDSTGLLSDKWQLIYRYCTRVMDYTPTGLTPLTVSRDVASSPQGSPRALALAGGRKGQRSNLWGGAR